MEYNIHRTVGIKQRRRGGMADKEKKKRKGGGGRLLKIIKTTINI
jgi:hypothetical protein